MKHHVEFSGEVSEETRTQADRATIVANGIEEAMSKVKDLTSREMIAAVALVVAGHLEDHEICMFVSALHDKAHAFKNSPRAHSH